MFKFSLLVLFSCFLWASCAKIDSETENINIEEIANKRYKRYSVMLDSLCSRTFAGRKAGTEGNKLALEYIVKELQDRNLTPAVQEFVHRSGEILHNITVFFPGVSDSLVVIGAHFDGQNESNRQYHYPAANDNGTGVVTDFMIIDSLLSSAKIKYSTIVAFWDGEEACIPPAFKGSTYWVRNFVDASKIILYVNIDSIGHNHDNIMYSTFWGTNRTKRMYDLLVTNSGFNIHPIERKQTEGASDYYSFSCVGIPNISFSDPVFRCSNPVHSTKDVPEVIAFDRLSKVTELIVTMIEDY